MQNPSKTTMAGRHLSKSASELSNEAWMEAAAASENRLTTGLTATAITTSVYHKAHTFLAQLKNRLGHRRQQRYDLADNASTLTMALRSGHSTPTARRSPLHRRFLSRADSPVAKDSGDSPGSSPIPPPRLKNVSPTIDLDLLPSTSKDDTPRRRELALRQYAFFQLRIHLRRGSALIAMDKNGSSDPYVKFKCGGRLMHKSRTIYRDLNPVWDESFTIPIEDPFVPIHIKVYDYDWGLQDDFMGASTIDLVTLDLNRSTDLRLELKDPQRSDTDLGVIYVNVTLTPKTQQDKEQYFQKNSRLGDLNRRLKSQIWSSVVTIALVEGRNLLPCDLSIGTSDPYVRFRLGNEKYKSRTVWRSLDPRWLEQFDLHLHDDGDQLLEITVWDKDRAKDDFMGRCVLDLSQFERETTHSLWQDLEDGSGSLHLLLTISGTTASETISDLTVYEENPRERNAIMERYSLQRTFHNVRDVGHLTVKVFKAQGLAAADLGGKSDPFCVLELGNARLQTQTEYKTLNPSWQKIFTFNVKDINSVLEITVYDEDRDHKVEFLGRLAIPLLRIRNGDKRWYALKDRKLRSRAKGNCPQLLLEMTVLWNPIRACLNTLSPKEEKYMQSETKFKREVFVKNVLRLKVFVLHFYEFGKLFQDCFEWESRIKSFAALMVFLVICYYWEPWMAPAGALLIFLRYYLVKVLTSSSLVESYDEPADSDPDEYDDDDKEKEEKKSLKERLQAIQEVTQIVQNAIGSISSLLEAIKNTFNFTVPFLSWIAIGLLVLAAFVLYFIHVRYLLMLWGTNKFLRRILRPNCVPNNEVLDLLSRVPDDHLLLDYKDLKLLTSGTDTDRSKRDAKKKHKTS